MPNPIHRFPDLDRGFSRYADPEEIDRVRTRRLVAKLFGIVRPTLAIQPPLRENVYIALDAVAWAAAMILASTEDRDALDFFTLALTQNLDRLETRNSDGHAAEAAGPVPPEASQRPRRIPPNGAKTAARYRSPLQSIPGAAAARVR